MRIALPVDESNEETKICISFGRAPYFLIYDTEKKEKEYMENKAASSPGGAGIKAAQFLVDQKADVLLTPRCGENAAEVLKEAGVKLYKTKDTSVDKEINLYLEGKSEILDEVHAGFHHGSN